LSFRSGENLGLKKGLTVETQARHRLTRRFLIAAASAALAPELHCYARLGDAEWMGTFRGFIDAFNDFVVSLDHNRLNIAAWERMKATFHDLEARDRNVK
jgi:hypothetical protein